MPLQICFGPMSVWVDNERLKTAYAYQQLLAQNGWLPNGTDFPIEDISPIKTFFAFVCRTNSEGLPVGGFQMENALTREQALRSETIWAAKAGFEEGRKGSIFCCSQNRFEELSYGSNSTHKGSENGFGRRSRI